MNEAEKMFNIGIGMLILVFFLTAALQVCYRAQDKARADVRSDIVRTQQSFANANATFAALVRPEILRNIVSSVHPGHASIGFNKWTSVNELKTVPEQ